MTRGVKRHHRAITTFFFNIGFGNTVINNGASQNNSWPAIVLCFVVLA
jgi:hypothetical protein